MTPVPEMISVIRVFVSSPGDVAEERRALDEVIDRINRTDGRALSARFELWKWETDTVPQIGPKPQSVIDNQVPAHYDIYLGIMKHRFGTPGSHGSGTEKELKDALRRWGKLGVPWILFYFAADKVAPNNLDLDQYSKVRQFRKELERKGLYSTYEGLRGSADAFFEKADAHLRNILRFLVSGWKRTTALPDPTGYLRALLSKTSHIVVRGLQVGQKRVHRFPIEDLLISLTTTQPATAVGTAKKGGGKDPEKDIDVGSERAASRSMLLELVLRNERLMVIGEAGAGKTTFLLHVAHSLCLTELGDVPAAAPTQLGITERTFPILVELVELDKYVTSRRNDPSVPAGVASAAWLQHYLAANCFQNGWSLDETFFRRKLDGGCTVLLDGLDEARDRPARERVSRLIEAIAGTYRRCRIVVTSRPAGYEGEARLPDFAHAQIDPLSDQAVETFLSRWCEALYNESPQAAGEHCSELLGALRARQEIRRMARNPVMLTALAVVHSNERRLPQQRADLYESIIHWLSRSREQRLGRGKAELTVALLQELALAMLDHPEGMRTEVDKRWAAEKIAFEIGGVVDKTSIARAAEFLDAEEIDSGIVVGRSGGVQFWHRTFQEYLGARAIAARPDEQQQELLWGSPERIYRPEWREVILLFSGILIQQGHAKVEGLLRNMLSDARTESDFHAQVRCADLMTAILRDLEWTGSIPGKIIDDIHDFEKSLSIPEHEKEALGFQWIIQEARRLLARGDYLNARQKLCEIPNNQETFWKHLKAEFAFVFNFENENDQDFLIWQNHRGQIEWRRKVWAALATDEAKWSSARFDGSSAPEGEKSEDSRDERTEVIQRPILNVRSEEKGETLEQDTLKLLRQIFVFNDDDVIVSPKKIRQQRRGSQFGCDIKLVYCRAIDNQEVRCLVECKSHEGELDFNKVLGKLFDAHNSHITIDHWILIAPRAHVIGNFQDELIEKLNITQAFPFTVQFWTKDTDVHHFFGLAPDLYDRWIDHPPAEPHPRQWSEQQIKHVRSTWLKRLEPPLRLPPPWPAYVTDQQETGVFIQNDDIHCLKELWRNDRFISPRALDATRTPLPNSLMDTVNNWIIQGGSRVCLVLGDFGDGKTAFTYMLSRQLLAKYRREPREGWIPVRFPLSRFARPGFNSHNFLRDRVEELGSTIPDWSKMAEQRNILAILDGMDEMTKTLNVDAVRRSIDLLVDCCRNQFERLRRIIITCRTPFFEELTQREYLKHKLGNPQIFYIAPFDKREVYEKLENLAIDSVQKLNLHRLSQMHDPIGLARKPLFLKMVTETISVPDSDFSSETAIYQSYIDNCLNNESKLELLESNGQHTFGAELKAGLLEIMERIAMEIHLAPQEYVCLRSLRDTLTSSAPDTSKFAHLLWKQVVDERVEGEDAVHRIGVRSLLHKRTDRVNDCDSDAWPVEFCHRSIREYFVARRIEKALRKGVSETRKIVERVDFNHEILRFTAELMKKSGHDYQRTLRDLSLMSRIEGNQQSSSQDGRLRSARLGRTAVTLLYSWLGRLPENDWSTMVLDGAQLSGADLTGKNFRNTSLKSANLNNVVFVDADFRRADLSGVRLEETGEVCSIAVPLNLDGFFAAYSDGSIRQWNVSDHSGEGSRIVYYASDRIGNRDRMLQISALPGNGLCLSNRNQVIFLNKADPFYKDAGAFEIQMPYLNVILKEDKVITVEKLSEGDHCTAKIFDFYTDSLPIKSSWATETSICCETLGNSGMVAALEDGRVFVHLQMAREREKSRIQSIQIAEFAHPSAIGSVCLVNGENEKSLIALGGRNGRVGLWEFSSSGQSSSSEHKELYREVLHSGPVTSVCFMGPAALLTGGVDGKIHLLDITDLGNLQGTRRTFELRLQCQGMKIDGLRGEYERAILEKAISMH